MGKYSSKWQFAIRIIIVIVALGLFVRGIQDISHYYKDRRLKKTPVSALIVQKTENKDNQILEYDFAGRTYRSHPVDKILYHYGTIGEKKNIYVQNKHPKRIFLHRNPTREAAVGTLFIGWGMFLGIIVYLERRILKILKRSKEKE